MQESESVSILNASLNELSASLSPVLRGEGRGEGPFSRAAQLAERALTLTLSPEYGGEGTGVDFRTSIVTRASRPCEKRDTCECAFLRIRAGIEYQARPRRPFYERNSEIGIMNALASTSATPPRANRYCTAVARLLRRRAVRCAIVVVLIPTVAWLIFLGAIAWWAYPSGIDASPIPATFVEDRSGVPLAALVAHDGQWRLPLRDEQINPHLLDAIVAVEDSRFFAHKGVDWRSAAMAAWEDLHGL